MPADNLSEMKRNLKFMIPKQKTVFKDNNKQKKNNIFCSQHEKLVTFILQEISNYLQSCTRDYIVFQF